MIPKRFATVLSLALAATSVLITQAALAQLPVNPGLTNGNFETASTAGWRTGGTQNHSFPLLAVNGDHYAGVEVGNGPFGQVACSNPGFANFGYLDQLFWMTTNHAVELDFLVPLPGRPDSTENAPCIGFDRIEIDFTLVEQNPYVTRLAGVILIDYYAATGTTQGHLQVNDFVLGTVRAASFNPLAFAPVRVGPLAVDWSRKMHGWLHASMELNAACIAWLPDRFTFRVTIRNEDNRFTGQDLSVYVDNVTAKHEIVPSSCGCDASNLDTDGDGFANCEDNCPFDPLKKAPGTCGCGRSDEDANHNGIPDCIDPAVAHDDQ